MMNKLKPKQAQESEPANATLRDLVAPLFRRKRLLGFSFLGLLVLAVAWDVIFVEYLQMHDGDTR